MAAHGARVRLPAGLDGPLPRLPAPVDAAARVWAAASGRVRAVVRLVVVAILLVAASGGLVRGPWGAPTAVLVATRTIAAGASVTAADVSVARRPSALVTDTALTTPSALPTDALAVGTLPAGTVVTTDHVVGGGPSSLATDGTAVVAVDAALLPPLPVGTRVDIAVPGFDGAAEVVARSATVVADDGTWRWLRVDRAEVPALAGGVSEGRLVTAVLPRPPGGAP